MSAFKDAIAKDVKTVFINLDEFAEEHNLNDEIVACIVDKDIISEQANKSEIREGVFVNTLTIYVDVKDVKERPVKGEQIRLDDEWYFVEDVSVEDGVLVIVVEANRQ